MGVVCGRLKFWFKSRTTGSVVTAAFYVRTSAAAESETPSSSILCPLQGLLGCRARREQFQGEMIITGAKIIQQD